MPKIYETEEEGRYIIETDDGRELDVWGNSEEDAIKNYRAGDRTLGPVSTQEQFAPNVTRKGLTASNVAIDLLTGVPRYAYGLARGGMEQMQGFDGGQGYQEAMAGRNTGFVGDVAKDPATALELGALTMTGPVGAVGAGLIAGGSEFAGQALKGEDASYIKGGLATAGGGIGQFFGGLLGRITGAEKGVATVIDQNQFVNSVKSALDKPEAQAELIETYGEGAFQKITQALRSKNPVEAMAEVGQDLTGVSKEALIMASDPRGRLAMKNMAGTKNIEKLGNELLTAVDNFSVENEISQVRNIASQMPDIDYRDVASFIKSLKKPVLGVTKAEDKGVLAYNKAIDELVDQFTPVVKQGMDGKFQKSQKTMSALDFWQKRKDFDKGVNFDQFEYQSTPEMINSARKQIRAYMADKLKNEATQAGYPEWGELMEESARKLSILDAVKEMTGSKTKSDLSRTQRSELLIDRLFGETSGMDLKREYLKEFEKIVGKDITQRAYLAQLAQDMYGKKASPLTASRPLAPVYKTGKAGTPILNWLYGPYAVTEFLIPNAQKIIDATPDLMKRVMSFDQAMPNPTSDAMKLATAQQRQQALQAMPVQRNWRSAIPYLQPPQLRSTLQVLGAQGLANAEE